MSIEGCGLSVRRLKERHRPARITPTTAAIGIESASENTCWVRRRLDDPGSNRSLRPLDREEQNPRGEEERDPEPNPNRPIDDVLPPSAAALIS